MYYKDAVIVRLCDADAAARRFGANDDMSSRVSQSRTSFDLRQSASDRVAPDSSRMKASLPVQIGDATRVDVFDQPTFSKYCAGKGAQDKYFREIIYV